MKTFIRITALLCLSPLVFAIGGKVFTWTPPNERIDGTALPNAEITEYRIFCDNNPIPIHVQPNIPLDTDTWAAPDGTFAIGTHICQAKTVDTEGQESDLSNSVNFIVSSARPNPPIFAVQ